MINTSRHWLSCSWNWTSAVNQHESLVLTYLNKIPIFPLKILFQVQCERVISYVKVHPYRTPRCGQIEHKTNGYNSLGWHWKSAIAIDESTKPWLPKLCDRHQGAEHKPYNLIIIKNTCLFWSELDKAKKISINKIDVHHILILCVTQCLSCNTSLFTTINVPFVLDHPQSRKCQAFLEQLLHSCFEIPVGHSDLKKFQYSHIILKIHF